MERAALIELLRQRIEHHTRERARLIPPSDPLPSDAAAWHRHDAALEAIAELLERIAGDRDGDR